MKDICLTCPVDKSMHPISDLVKDNSLKRGYRKMCKACQRERSKRYWQRTRRENTDNKYATGIAPEIRTAIMDLEMPEWEKRFEVIDHYKLDITDEGDTCKIDRVLALHCQ
jgi:hypothetical protein